MYFKYFKYIYYSLGLIRKLTVNSNSPWASYPDKLRWTTENPSPKNEKTWENPTKFLKIKQLWETSEHLLAFISLPALPPLWELSPREHHSIRKSRSWTRPFCFLETAVYFTHFPMHVLNSQMSEIATVFYIRFSSVSRHWARRF